MLLDSIKPENYKCKITETSGKVTIQANAIQKITEPLDAIKSLEWYGAKS